MNFCNNLQSLRKKQNMSQEQLAEKLGVTRQSVSKWESGQSYPEMDKLNSMCDLFNCSLDDLIKGDPSNNDQQTTTKKTKFDFNNIIEEFLATVKATVNMVSKMNSKEIVKLVIEVFIILCVIAVLKMPFNYIENFGSNIFMELGTLGSIFNSSWNIILEFSYLILSILLFFYIFKTKYLEEMTFEHVYEKEIKKDNEKEQTEEPYYKNEKTKNKKDKSFGIISLLSSIVLFFVKLMVLGILIPLALGGFFLVIALAFDIILLIQGVHLFGILIGVIGGLILTISLSEILFDFVLDYKIPVKKTFISFVLAIILMGTGVAFATTELAKFSYINELPKNYKMEVKKETIDMNKNLLMNLNCSDEVNYIEDNSIKNIRVEISYYDEFTDPSFNVENNKVHFYQNEDEININNIYNSLLENLKENKIYNYDLLDEIKINIYANKSNLNILKNNSESYCTELNENNSEYENEIYNLEEENSNLQSQNYELQEENTNLENENDELKQKNDDLKDSIKSLLEE